MQHRKLRQARLQFNVVHGHRILRVAYRRQGILVAVQWHCAAQLAVLHDPQSKHGEQLALEVLAQAPDSERALLALLEHQLALRQFKPLTESMERLTQSAALSAAGHTALANSQISVARLHDSGVQSVAAVDAAALRASARQHLQRAMALDALHPLPVYALGWLLASQGDVVAVREFAPTAERLYYQQPYSEDLANLLIRLHALAGDTDAEFKFAVVARRLASNSQDQFLAQRRIDRLRPAAKAMPELKP